MKPEETQQESCAGNLEKALRHQPRLLPFFILTAQDSSVDRLGSLAICALRDPILNHKVDQMVLISYDGQRRRMCLCIYASGFTTDADSQLNIYICMCVCVCVCA